MALRQSWYIAAMANEVGRTPLGRILLDEPVVLYRTENGTPVALEDRCAHRRVPLSHGELVGDAVQCPYHGFQFAASGVCVRVPGLADSAIPSAAKVRAFPVVQRHGFVWIWMGVATQADPALISDFHTNDDPAWATTGAHMHCAAEYRLFVDNLLDLSHVAFIHKGTIGTDDSSAEMRLDRGPGFVRFTRAAIDVATPPHNVRQGFGPRCDLTKVMTFLPPGHVTIEVTTTERLEASTMGTPKCMHILIINAMTPERAGSCHYFWATTRDFQIDDPAVTAFFHQVTMQAFTEDLGVLALQQAAIDRAPDAPIVSVPGDAGGIAARRLLDELIARENAALAAE
jgi:phenylpropionate dioxygenase-like ring-hydroxylating dioxygenase large terminal subunit